MIQNDVNEIKRSNHLPISQRDSKMVLQKKVILMFGFFFLGVSGAVSPSFTIVFQL